MIKLIPVPLILLATSSGIASSEQRNYVMKTHNTKLVYLFKKNNEVDERG